MPRHCNQIGCEIRPSFNYQGQTNVLYCASHKLDYMVDVKSKKCLQIGCNICPTYNYQGQTKGLYCNAHKLDGMV
jgi:hypothetical protein